MQAGIKRRAECSTGNQRRMREKAAESGRQVEAVTAEQAEVMSQDVAVERLAKLGAWRTPAYAAGQAGENGTRHGT